MTYGISTWQYFIKLYACTCYKVLSDSYNRDAQNKSCLLNSSHVTTLCDTVEQLLKDHPIGHKNIAAQDRWPLVTDSLTLKCRTFCRKPMVIQDRQSVMTAVSQNSFHCICKSNAV